MATITTRAGKGSPLTNTEVDDNFSNLNSAKYESGANPTFAEHVYLTPSDSAGTNTTQVAIGHDRAGNGYAHLDFVGDATYSDYGLRILRGNGGENAFSQITHRGTNKFYINMPEGGSEFVLNEGSYNTDFRVESNDNANMLFVDASTNRVGVGVAAPQANLQALDLIKVSSTDQSSGSIIFGDGSTANYNVGIGRWNGSSNAAGSGGLGYHAQGPINGGGHYWYLGDAAAGSKTEVMRINGSGTFIFNEGGLDQDFRVESSDHAHMLFVDASTNRAYVGGSTNVNTSALQVTGQAAQQALVTKVVDNNYSLFQGFNASNALITQITGAGALTHNGTAAFNSSVTVSSSVTVGTKVFTGGMTLTNNDSGRIGFNRNPDTGAAVNSASLERHQINGANSAGDYLDFQGYNSSGTYVGGFHLDDGAFVTVPTAGKAAVFNESGIDADFRIETDTRATAFYVDADTDTIYLYSKESEAGSRFTINNDGSVTGHLQFQTAVNTQNNGYVRANIVMSRNKNQITWDSSTGKWNHAGGSSTDWSMLSHTSSGFRAYTGASVSDATQFTNTDFNDAYLNYYTTPTGGHTWEAPGGGGFVFNERGLDRDFRVESNGNANMLFVDGGGDGVGIGTNVAGNSTLEVRSTGVDGTYQNAIGFQYSGNSNEANTISTSVSSIAGSSGFKFNCSDGGGSSGKTSVAKFVRNEISFNDDSYNFLDFRVESDTNSHAIFLDASANSVRFMKDSGSNTVSGMMWNHNDYLGITTTSTDTGDRLLLLNRQGGDGDVIEFRTVNLKRGEIEATTTGVTYSTTSDRRLKKDIETITDGTDKLMAMNPVTHGWKADPEADTVHGFIAQEMLDIVPEAVSGDPEGEDMMSMDYGRITPVLVAALQDAHKKIAELETRLNELEGK